MTEERESMKLLTSHIVGQHDSMTLGLETLEEFVDWVASIEPPEVCSECRSEQPVNEIQVCQECLSNK